MNRFILPAAMLSALTATAALAAGPDAWTVQGRIDLEGQGKWDYAAVDDVRQRLYLSRGDHVQIVQLPAGTPVANIAGTPGVHGFAFAQDLKLGFISVGRANVVKVVDLDTLQPREDIKAGANPDAIVYDAPSHKVFAFNGKSRDVTVIDARTLAVVATIPVGGRPESAVSDGAGRVYVNIEDNAGIDAIDTASNSVAARWKLDGCDEPSGLALDVEHERLFSTCQNRIMAVTDARTGARVTTVAIGEHPDAAVFDAASGTVFSSNGGGAGTLTAVRADGADRYRVAAELPTLKGAKTLGFDGTSRRVYLPAVAGGRFTVLVVGPVQSAQSAR